MESWILKGIGLSRERVQALLGSPKPVVDHPEKKRQAPPRYTASQRLAKEAAEAKAHYQQILERNAGKTVA